jgi:hypothetical protein
MSSLKSLDKAVFSLQEDQRDFIGSVHRDLKSLDRDLGFLRNEVIEMKRSLQWVQAVQMLILRYMLFEPDVLASLDETTKSVSFHLMKLTNAFLPLVWDGPNRGVLLELNRLFNEQVCLHPSNIVVPHRWPCRKSYDSDPIEETRRMKLQAEVERSRLSNASTSPTGTTKLLFVDGLGVIRECLQSNATLTLNTPSPREGDLDSSSD